MTEVANQTEPKNIRELRAERGLSQFLLAAHLETSTANISQWENKLHRPSRRSLKDICAFFGVTPDQLDLAPEKRGGGWPRIPDVPNVQTTQLDPDVR